ncbi:MAG: carbohydrate kinase [Clostridia bacterium]|nr:carbohydrate kinase [Clostridia bacterium]
MTPAGPQVLGLGEVLWDMLPEGKRCGGAPANVICHLERLGIRGAVVSAVGKDPSGDELLDFLSGKGLDTSFISRNDLPTGQVNVSLDDGIPRYEIAYPAAWDAIRVPDALGPMLPGVRAAIYGTLAQRDERSRSAIRSVLASLPDPCWKLFDINLRQRFYDAATIRASLDLADVLKINDEELPVVAELFGLTGDRDKVAAFLMKRWDLRYVILTCGADGSLLYDGRECFVFPAGKCRKVEDTVGCGDAFLAAWCASMLRGESPRHAMEAGSELAARVAEHRGALL